MRESRLVNMLLPIVTSILLVAAWQFSVWAFSVPAYLIPPPLDVLIALKAGLIGGTLWPHIAATTTAILIGYALGCSSALLSAAVVAEFPLFRRAVYPLIIAFQAIPKVALAPLLVVWFGFDLASKVVMIALICFFPTFVNAFVGLSSYDRNLADLYKTFGAGRWQILASIKIPSALGAIFAGLEISVVLALLGAVLAEIVASRRGLGYVIQSSGVDFNIALMFACIVILGAIGVILSQIVILARRKFAFWEDRRATSVSGPGA
jgi:NitT/TauT family transport system permease protein